MLARRKFLQASAALPLLAACAGTLPLATGPGNYSPSGVPLRRVNVAADRVIRNIAGLRPFRPHGFRVAAQPLNDKLVIHNYGHGGGGITLSWGSSFLASELALETSHRRCAVIGSGIMG
ncbi:MAG: FAD-dependent oxidoreductase, partial [Gammaproteobacteria bacterium]